MQCELVQKLDGKFPVLKNNGTHTNGITANANTWKSGTAIQCNATKEFIFVRPQLWSGLWTRQSGDLESSLCSPSIICKWCKQVAADLSHTEKLQHLILTCHVVRQVLSISLREKDITKCLWHRESHSFTFPSLLNSFSCFGKFIDSFCTERPSSCCSFIC